MFTECLVRRRPDRRGRIVGSPARVSPQQGKRARVCPGLALWPDLWARHSGAPPDLDAV